PILIDPRNLSAVSPSKLHLLRTDQTGENLFELARAMGVTFSRIRGGRYQADGGAAQAWGGLFALYASEGLGGIGDPTPSPCQNKDQHLASGTFDAFATDAGLQLCFLAAVKDLVGWPAFTKFFQSLPQGGAWDTALPADAGPVATWTWIEQQLSQT